MTNISIVGKSYLNRSSPIPTDPVYENYGDSVKNVPKVNRQSPIPNDHIYSEGEYNISVQRPRATSEGLKIARNHQDRDLAYLFNPEFNFHPIGMKLIQKSHRDHEKENYKKIKELQKANKEKQVESSRTRRVPVKAVYKPDKFDHIQSKVIQQIQTPLAPCPKLHRSNSSSNIDKTNTSIFKEQSNKENKSKDSICLEKDSIKRINYKRPSSAGVNKRPSPVGSKSKENDVAFVEKRPTRPYSACELGSKKTRTLSPIALNKQAVQKIKQKKSPSEAAFEELKMKKKNEITQYKRGNVPKYLRNRQSEWKKAEENRIANLPDPSVPEGHSLMPAEERLNTLSMLQKSQKDLLAELRSIPISQDTLRIKCRKDVLERKLQEVDTALKIFSRPRVFVKDE